MLSFSLQGNGNSLQTGSNKKNPKQTTVVKQLKELSSAELGHKDNLQYLNGPDLMTQVKKTE